MICAKSGDVAMAAFLAVKSWSRAAFPSRRSSVRNTWSLPNPFQRRRRCYWRCTRRRAQFPWLCSHWGRSTSRRRLRC